MSGDKTFEVCGFGVGYFRGRPHPVNDGSRDRVRKTMSEVRTPQCSDLTQQLPAQKRPILTGGVRTDPRGARVTSHSTLSGVTRETSWDRCLGTIPSQLQQFSRSGTTL